MSSTETQQVDTARTTGTGGLVYDEVPLVIPSHVIVPYYSGTKAPENDNMAIVLTDSQSVPVRMPLTDVRPKVNQYSLEGNGFQYVKDKGYSTLSFNRPNGTESENEWYHDREERNRVYFPHLERLLTDTVKPAVIILSSAIIRDAPRWHSTDNSKYRQGRQAPAPRPHIDYSRTGSYAFLSNMHRGIFEDTGRSKFVDSKQIDVAMEKKDEVLNAMKRCAAKDGVTLEHWDGSNYDGPRWMILSTWRPLETVRKDPLGVMDSRTIKYGEETFPMERWYDSFVGFSKGFRAWNDVIRPPQPRAGTEMDGHQWHWMSAQTPEDVLLIKIFDSETAKAGSKVAGPAAHFALHLEGTEEEPARKSIEVRCYLFW